MVPQWPHPEEGSVEVLAGLRLCPTSFRYLLQCEGDWIFQFLNVTIETVGPLRELAPGYPLTVSGIWFRSLDVQHQVRVVQDQDVSDTDSPWTSEEVQNSEEGSVMTSESGTLIGNGEEPDARIAVVRAVVPKVSGQVPSKSPPFAVQSF